MDHFEFILIITSVIYALAVAQILAGISRIAQSSSAVRPFLPHTIWVLNLFVFIFLIWWASWEFRAVQWTFPQYAYMLIAPTLLFFACSLLIPRELQGMAVSMEEHFYRIRRPLFVSYFLAALAVIVDGNLLADEPLWHDGRYGRHTARDGDLGLFHGQTQGTLPHRRNIVARFCLDCGDSILVSPLVELD